MKTYDIAKHGYLVNEAALTDLARRYADGIEASDGARATYLQVLVAHTKQELGKAKNPTQPQQLSAIDETHGKLYAIVLDAITTTDLAPDDDLPKEESKRRSRERNRRSTFARTSKSALRRWVEAGGKLSSLEPATVTKESLRTPRAAVQMDVDAVIARAQETLERALKVVVVQDADAAQELVNDIQQRLQAVVTPPKPLTATRQRVGSLTLTPHS